MITTTTKDVHQCYRFMLGREPEIGADLAGRTVEPVVNIIASFISSQEFEHSIVKAILEDGMFRPPSFHMTPPRILLDWAANYMPISVEGAESLAGARTWFIAFKTLFLDPDFNREVLLPCDVAPRAEFLERVIERAADTLGRIEEVLLDNAAVTLIVVPAEGAPLDYVPEVITIPSNGCGQQTDGDVIISHKTEGKRHRVSIGYSGDAASVVMDIYLDAELLIERVSLSPGASCGDSAMSIIGSVDKCGPIAISGWMKPLGSPDGNKFEVLIDDNISGIGAVSVGQDEKLKEAGAGAFVFAIPRLFKDGRAHRALVRRFQDGKVLPSAQNTFTIGVPALEAEWRQDGLVVWLDSKQAAELQPAQAKIILTTGMTVIGEHRLSLTIGGNRQLVTGAFISAAELIPFLGMHVTATLCAPFAEISVLVSSEQVTGPLVGAIDKIDPEGRSVFGWCAYRRCVDHSLVLEGSIDGDVIGKFRADLARTELVDVFGKGFHGFHIRIPKRYQDGRTHTLALRDPVTDCSIPDSPFAFTLNSNRITRSFIAPGVVDSLRPVRSVNSFPTTHMVAKRVTAVILTRNGAEVLRECLASIWKYTPASLLDIVIVDHESVDETPEIVKQWSSKLSIHYHYVNGNNSFSFSNNWAIKYFSDSEYILLLNNDIIFIEDIIAKMTQYLDKNKDVALVGCKLLEARDHTDLTKSSIHHLGIQLNLASSGFVEPFEAVEPTYFGDQVSELTSYSVTGACAMMRRDEYLSVAGLEESYYYGGEDVELGEAVWADLGKKVVCLNNIVALHHRGWLRLSARGAEGWWNRVQRNSLVMRQRLGYQMRKRHARGLIDPERRWAAGRARMGFVVLESGPIALNAAYFTAAEAGGALAAQYGLEIQFIEPDGDWYDVRGLTHVINLLHDYRISECRSDRTDYCKIAWLRDDFEAWVQSGELVHYHIILCASRAFCRELADVHGITAVHVPAATNLEAMRSGQPVSDHLIDVLFNGSQREVARCFVDSFDEPFWHDKVAIYGPGWDKVAKAKPMWRGIRPYSEMNDLCASARMVIDHAYASSSRWGATNGRVFDAIAAGCLPLTNSQASSEADFDALLPVWSNPDDLRQLVAHYLEHEDERRTLVNQLAGIVEQRHQYADRAATIAGAIWDTATLVHSVAIKIAAPSRAEARICGEALFAETVARALRRRGLYVKVQCLDEWNRPNELFDAALVVRGPSRYELRGDELVLGWVISNPDALSAEELSHYDAVAFGSETLAKRHGTTAIPTAVVRRFSAFADGPGVLPQAATSANAMLDHISDQDVIFVGNVGRRTRQFIIDMAEQMPIKIIGKGWDQYVPMDMVLGSHIDNAALPRLYHKAFAVLNDHSPDMREANLLSSRVVDVVTSGGLVISDWHEEGASLVAKDMFFKSAIEAGAALRRFRADPDSRAHAISHARSNLLRRCDAQVSADRIFELLSVAHNNRMAGSKRSRTRQQVAAQ